MPWRIPEADIERVKRETDLVALVQSRGIELRKHGSKDWKGLCPFHNDRQTPNLVVSPEKGLFHCMACGKAGNAQDAHRVLAKGVGHMAQLSAVQIALPVKRVDQVVAVDLEQAIGADLVRGQRDGVDGQVTPR